MAKLVECIPNFSCSKERSPEVYDALVKVAESVPGCTLFDAQTDGDHNRSVFTMIGSPEAIEAELRERFVIGANKAYAVTRLMKKAKFILVTALDKQLAKDMLFTAAVDEVDEALKLAEQYVGKDYTMTLMPTGSLTVPLYKG